MTHIELKTIHGDAWIMHKDNVKNVSLVNTPDAFLEQWPHEKVVILTSTELNPEDQKPWQFMVSNKYTDIRNQLCGKATTNNLVKTK